MKAFLIYMATFLNPSFVFGVVSQITTFVFHFLERYLFSFTPVIPLYVTESTVGFRRGSASLVEMLQCKKLSLTMVKSPCLCPLQNLASTKSTENFLSFNPAQNPSLLSCPLPPHHHSHHDLASHFISPLLSLN